MKSPAYYRLKILHLISGDLWAGAETMAYNLLNRLKDYDDLDITVILFNEGRLADQLRAGGLIVQVVDENLNSFREILRKIRNIVSGNLPDIIHSHRYKENLLALLISRNYRGIELVSTQHGLPEFYIKKTGFMQRLKTRANFFTLARYFTTVAVSEDIRSVLLSRFGFYKERVEVIHNGVELPDLSAPGGKTGPFVIGSSGRLFPVKDYPLMVEIARTVYSTGVRDIRFELAGDGPELHAVESLIQHYGLNAGFVLKGHQDSMDNFYRSLDIYLNTSVHEGIPMTILEALAYGLPVIAPNVGGIVEIIDDGKEGFLIDSRFPDDFAEKCLFLKENQDVRENMALAARAKVGRAFSTEIMARNYYRLYRRTVAPSWHH
jgi:L-malate glycosyltransferase